MKPLRSLLAFPLFILCLVASSASIALAQDWQPVDSTELALKSPVVEKDADAEVLSWEVKVDDGKEYDLVFTNYIRIKVFTERGKESQSKVEIPYLNHSKIKDIAARTIKADGTIVELGKADIFDRTIVKANGVKLKVKSFAMPAVEPGSIIEYHWREVRENAWANHIRLEFQREIPIQKVSYLVKPSSAVSGEMHYHRFNVGELQFVKDKDGFSRATMTNVPAFHEEANMPPEREVRPWLLLYYETNLSRLISSLGGGYWQSVGKVFSEAFNSATKVNDAIRKSSAEIIGDAKTPEEKLTRLYDFCRTKIKNLSDDASGLSPDEVAKAKENKTAADTLKRGMGDGQDIDALFAALASAAGFETRLALSGNRGDSFFNPNVYDTYFLGSSSIAVKVGEQWRFFSPSEMYTPFGMLGWREEGQEALICDPQKPFWVKTPLSGPEKSMEKRTAKLRLSEDGTLEGDVHVEYTGHLGFEKKEFNDDDSPAQREETLRDAVKSMMSTAELSDIKIENVQDVIKPFTYEYHVRVPGYAQRTGKRLFLQPAFFEHGVSPLFPSSTRTNEIYFHFPWSEEDHVEIEVPAGFAFDNADAPAPFRSGELTSYNVRIAASKDGRLLVYERKFFFGGGLIDFNQLRIPVQSYTPLKTFFDRIQQEDNHTITLKQAATTASN